MRTNKKIISVASFLSPLPAREDEGEGPNTAGLLRAIQDSASAPIPSRTHSSPNNDRDEPVQPAARAPNMPSCSIRDEKQHDTPASHSIASNNSFARLPLLQTHRQQRGYFNRREYQILQKKFNGTNGSYSVEASTR